MSRTEVVIQRGKLAVIVVNGGRLIVADTNNSLIRYLDLNMEQAELQTLELKGVNPNP